MGLLCVTSCGHEEVRKVPIYRLDKELSYGIMPEGQEAMREAELLFENSGYPELNPIILGDYSEKPSIREHLKGVENEFPDTERESAALGKIFASMEELLPDADIPEVYTIISPFSQSILVTDSLLYIGLNHYLGTDYEL